MVKTIISLTNSQMKALSEKAQEYEISKSELLRRIIHTYLINGDDLSKGIKEDPAKEQ